MEVLFGGYWWLSALIAFRSPKDTVFQILTKMFRGTRFPDGTKNGTKLAEIIFCLIARLIQHFKYRCLLLQSYTFVPN